MTKKLETIGFWFNPDAPSTYPRAQALVGPWAPETMARVVAYLRAGQTFATYGATSWCRFGCTGADAADLGRRDLTDGTFVWPEGLAHAVERHHVRLPDRFVDHALAGAPPRPVDKGTLVDDKVWIAWGRAQGACLDLEGWEVPGTTDRRKITRQLGLRGMPHIVLANPTTRHVVIARRDGSLEIRHVVDGGDPPRTLPGWHAWPTLPAAHKRA